MEKDKAIILVVGFIFAIMTFDYVYSKVMESCNNFMGCDILAIIAALISFLAVLAFFNEQLRMFVKTMLRIR